MNGKIDFLNGNKYKGNFLNGQMDGNGLFIWYDGCTFKGFFSKNKICGLGKLCWPDGSSYDGYFYKNYRHGHGTITFSDRNKSFDGEWVMGSKHGNGSMKYSEDFYYDGEWCKNVKAGYGRMIYSKKSLYCGQWLNNRRHGIGTMIWENNDCYNGEWENGKMNGSGHYVWAAAFNDTFCVQNINVYYGQWRAGQREGQGVLELGGRGGGVVCRGNFLRNRKQGSGSVICGNGNILQHQCLFDDDKINKNALDVSRELRNSLVNISPECIDVLTHIKKHRNHPESPDVRCKAMKCKEYPDTDKLSTERFSNCVEYGISHEKIKVEEKLLRNCLRRHNGYLTHLYDVYSSTIGDKKCSPKPFMMRIFLWQLFTDCKFPKKGVILTNFDELLHKNSSYCFQSAHYPFEKVFFWQFLHTLLEASWLLYGNTQSPEDHYGVTADIFNKFIQNDILPNAGTYTGSVLTTFKDILPMMSMYKLYLSIGDVHNIFAFIKYTYHHRFGNFQNTHVPNSLKNNMLQKNVIGIGDQLFYLSEKNEDNQDSFNQKLNSSILKMDDLTCKKILQCVAKIYPMVKKSGLIVGMNTRLTFLEFYEIIILCINHSCFKKSDGKQVLKKINK